MNNKNKILKFSFLVAILLGSFLINSSASATNYVCLCKGYDPASVTNQQKIVNTCTSSNFNSSFVYPCETYCRGKENIDSCIPETIAAPAQIGGPTIATTTAPKFKLPDYVFQIPIGALSKLQIVDCNNGEMCNIPFLAQYISAVYKYGLSIAGVLGVLMLMAAGLLWMVSGGDSGKINAAKQMIFGSITGLILLVGLVAFLSFINPKLAVTNILSIPSIKRIDLEVINKEEIQGCVGAWKTNKVSGVKFNSTVIDAIKTVAAQRKIDPCVYYAIISQESQGKVKALADDRLVANCDIGARRKFICAKYPSCCGKECKDATCKGYVEDKKIKPPLPNPNDISTFDLSGATTYGLGLGQITYRKEYGLCNGNKGFIYFNKCYNFSDLLTKPEVNLNAMSDGILNYYCSAAANNGTPTLNCFAKYAGSGAWAQCTGGKKLAVYNQCKKEGIDVIANKNWTITTE